jgi:hypothetical protein
MNKWHTCQYGNKIKIPNKPLITNYELKKNSGFMKKNAYKVTKDYVFAIKPSDNYDQNNSDFLYINKNYDIDKSSALYNLIINNFIIKDKEELEIKHIKNGIVEITEYYDKYKFYKTLKDDRPYIDGVPLDDDYNINENDCLQFGECLTYANQTYDKSNFEKILKNTKNPPVLQSKASLDFFGEVEDAEKNAEILNNINIQFKNNKAVPFNGESYVIVRKPKSVYTASPYHAAFVLYTHNDINITLEASADNATNSEYLPKFGFYDINEKGYTFHRCYSGELHIINYYETHDENELSNYCDFYYDSETIVLESRPLKHVIKEFIDEKIIPKKDNKRAYKNIDESPRKSRRKTIVGGKSSKRKSVKSKKNRF